MNWETQVGLAESMLRCPQVPGAEQIISLIKKVNPTSLKLSEPDRERGYRLKGELQNLLLENYGELFKLDPHPYSNNILLIKHKTIPTIDACHTRVHSLSPKALDAVEEVPVLMPEPAQEKPSRKADKPEPATAPKDVLRVARALLDRYDYGQAEELLADIRIAEERDLPALLRAAAVLVEEMGAFESAARMLLSQPRRMVKNKEVRELLALTYYGRGMIPEARALFETLHAGDLKKGALFAYADISCRDENLSLAHSLLVLSESKEGVLPSESGLRARVEEGVRALVDPMLREAGHALERCDRERAEALVRVVLADYPHFQEARRLLGRIEAMKSNDEVQAMWRQLEGAESGRRRLELLTRLLGMDRENEERIRDLIATEKSVQKQRTMEERLLEFRDLVARKEWSRCFDLFIWLSRRDEELCRAACEISPYLPALHGRLIKLPVAEAKEVWLSYVKVKTLLSAGETDGCLELMQGIKRHFQGEPWFQEEYERLMEHERTRAKTEADKLLYFTIWGEATLSEARERAARIRKFAAVLPEDKAAWYRSAVQTMLACYFPDKNEEERLEEYRIAVTIGNAATAASLKSAAVDVEPFAAIDAELAARFAVSVEPIAVTASPDAPVDLATEPLGTLKWVGATAGRVLLREDGETLIVVDLERYTAARYRSPHFKDLGLLDALPGRDHYLFVNTTTWNDVWRARLSEKDACFCAEIKINEHFTYEEGASFEGMYMSCCKDNDYYAFIREGERLRAVRQSLDVDSSAVRSFRFKGEPREHRRLCYGPDSFFVTTEAGTFVLNGNLDVPHGINPWAQCSPVSLVAADTKNSNVYIFEDFVKVLNSKLKAFKMYRSAISISITPRGIKGVCTATDTALISIGDGRCNFYNLNTNAFSQSFPISRVMWTDTPTRWHVYEYDRDASAMVVKDITDRLDALFEWRVLCTADQDEDTRLANLQQLADPSFFTLP